MAAKTSNGGTFKDEGGYGPIAGDKSIDAVHHHRHQIEACSGDFIDIKAEHSDIYAVRPPSRAALQEEALQ